MMSGAALYEWGHDIGREIREGTREPRPEVWLDGYGRPIPWRTSSKPFPRGFRDGLAGIER